MIAPSELRAVPLFSGLAEPELEHLAKNVADIHLIFGEFAVHEGESRALIVTIEGKLEVIKRVDSE